MGEEWAGCSPIGDLLRQVSTLESASLSTPVSHPQPHPNLNLCTAALRA